MQKRWWTKEENAREELGVWLVNAYSTCQPGCGTCNDSESPVMLLQHMPDHTFHTCHRGHRQVIFQAFYSESLISYCLVFVTKDCEERQVWGIRPSQNSPLPDANRQALLGSVSKLRASRTLRRNESGYRGTQPMFPSYWEPHLSGIMLTRQAFCG